MKKVSALLFSALFALCAAPLFAADSSPRITGGVLFSGGTLILNVSQDVQRPGALGQNFEFRKANGARDEIAGHTITCPDINVGESQITVYCPSISSLDGLVGNTYILSSTDLVVGQSIPIDPANAEIKVVDDSPHIVRTARSIALRQYASYPGTRLYAAIGAYQDEDWNSQTLEEDLENCADEGRNCEYFGGSGNVKKAECGAGELCEIVFDGLTESDLYLVGWETIAEEPEGIQYWRGGPLHQGADLSSIRFESSDGLEPIFSGAARTGLKGCWMVQPKSAPAPDAGAFDFGKSDYDNGQNSCSVLEHALLRSDDIVRIGAFSLRSDANLQTPNRFDFAIATNMNVAASASYIRENRPLDPGSDYSLYLFVTDSAYVYPGSSRPEIRSSYMLRADFTTPGAALPQLTSLDFPDSVFTGSLPLEFSAQGEMAWFLVKSDEYENIRDQCMEMNNGLDARCFDYIEQELGFVSRLDSIGGSKKLEIDVPEGGDAGIMRGEDLVLLFYTRTPGAVVGNGDDIEDQGEFSYVRAIPFVYADNYKKRFAIDFGEERTMEPIEPPYGWTTDPKLKKDVRSFVEAENIPLTPGQNVYIVRDVNAPKPALAWTIEVPERPAAQTIDVPKNDLQYIFLTDSLEWEFGQICKIDYLDFPCETSDEPEMEGEDRWGSLSDFGSMPILLSRSTPSLRYRNPATETTFRSEIGTVDFKADGPEFAPYAELSGQFVRLNAAKNFSGTFDKARIAFVTDDSDEEVVGPYFVTRFDAGLLAPGKHRATFALYLPRADAQFDEDNEFMPPPADDEPIFEGESDNIRVLQEAVPLDYVLVAIDSAEIDVPDLSKAVLVGDTALSPWAMVGLGGDMEDLSETGLKDADVLGWSETEEWDERWAKYRALDRVFAGEGVWIWAEDTVKFDRPYVGSDGMGDNYVSVRLRSRDFGWNLLANPYPFGIPASLAGDAQLYAWDREAGDYVEIPRNGVVAPFQAFWIHAEENATLDIPGRAMFESDVVDEPASAEPADLMRVSLRAGAYRDANNYVGVGDSARSRGEFPLAMGAGVTLTSLRDGSGWESDVRGADDVLHWSFAVSSRVSGLARGELALENRGALESLGYRLWTSQNGKLSEVRGDAPVAVALPASGSRVELYAARSKDLLEKELSRGSSGWKVRSSWDRAQGRADFRFSLDEPADLELRLLDASGRPIASQSASFGAGAQNWSWSASAPPASAVFWSISGGNLRAEGSF
ncbi:MAG: hypothetical protein J6Y56_03215 [Fibrobacterales bacterium]|nr:hypothetical protein [Fibrobacterales bacterium]